MFCTQCGAQLREGARFCTNCGAAVAAPVVETPIVETPVYEAPIVEEPVYEAPVVETPIVETPIYEAPIVEEPVYEAPVAETPVEPAPVAPVVSAEPVYAPAPVAAPQPEYQASAAPAPVTEKPEHNGSVGFIAAIKLFFKNYFNYTGRASKSEFWWGYLFASLISLTIAAPMATLGLVSLTIRRFHDIGKHWPWYFITLIPTAGLIIMIIEFCKDSEGDNAWGPGPKVNA